MPPPVVAARILAERFAEPTGDPAVEAARAARRTFPLAPFQEDGVRRLRRILDQRGGAMLADAVGLGKTYMALALVEEALAGGGPVTVAVPAALRPVWRPLLRRLRAGSSAGRLALVSHAQLSRGGYPSGLAGRGGLLVVDEAHRFRNPRTHRYAALARLADGARVLLVTATPVNNGLADLYWLLRLFAPDDAFVDLGIASLAELIGTASTRTAAAAAPGRRPGAVRHLSEAVMVRRTRAALAPAGPDDPARRWPVRFPARAAPSIVRYDDPRIPELVAAIEALELAPYADSSPALLRLGLLKRMESGAPALAASVARQLGVLRSCLDAAAAGLRLAPRQLRVPSGSGDGDPLQLLLFDLVADAWPPGEDRWAAMASMERDVATLRRVARMLAGPDPKLDALRRLARELAAGKAVIFTEYRDTAAALWRELIARVPTARIDGGGAWLGAHRAGRRAVVERFAPAAGGVAPPPRRERVAILIATDVLAEGMNLQDARHVVGYDLPWNPVRLMQRIGRVDRLGSPHDVIVPHLFLPARGLDAVLGLTRRIARKLGDIAGAVGAEDAIELLAGLDRGGAAAAAALERAASAGDDPLADVRARWAAAPIGVPVSAGDQAPLIAPAPPGIPTIALARRGDRTWLLEMGADGVVTEAGDATILALDRLARSTGSCDGGLGPADDAVDRLTAAIADCFAGLDAAHAAPPRLGHADPAARLAGRIRAALADRGIAAAPAQVARADLLLRELDRPLGYRSGVRAREVVDQRRGDLDALLEAAENVVIGPGHPRRRPPPQPARGEPAPGLVAALVETPPLG